MGREGCVGGDNVVKGVSNRNSQSCNHIGQREKHTLAKYH